MGSCVSIQKDPKSAMKFRMVMGTRAAKAASPAGDGLPSKSILANAYSNGIRSPDFGSKNEIFFDSRGWLDSDCEDFFSVNGDFTPSRGSTPNHQTGTLTKPKLDDTTFDGYSDAKSESSPRKKLGEFLQETTLHGKLPKDDGKLPKVDSPVNGKIEVNGTPETNLIKDKPPKSVDGTHYLSGTNSVCTGEITPIGDSKNGKEKRAKVMPCCLPSLIHSASVSERKKQAANPRYYD